MDGVEVENPQIYFKIKFLYVMYVAVTVVNFPIILHVPRRRHRPIAIAQRVDREASSSTAFIPQAAVQNGTSVNVGEICLSRFSRSSLNIKLDSLLGVCCVSASGSSSCEIGLRVPDRESRSNMESAIVDSRPGRIQVKCS